jgi:hypothetical protein
MRTGSGDLSIDCTTPMANFLVMFVLVAGLGYLAGYWLMQPRVIPNMGLAAYEPPPGTRLLPLPHKMDAPELAEPDLVVPGPVETAVAKTDPPPQRVENPTVASKPIAKRPRARPRPAEDPWSAFAYSGHSGYGEPWGRSWSSGRSGYSEPWGRSWSSGRSGWNQRW